MVWHNNGLILTYETDKKNKLIRQKIQQQQTTKPKKNNSKNTRKRKLGCFLNWDWRVVEFYDPYIYPGNYHSASCINKIELFQWFLCVSISGSGNGFSSTEPFWETGRASTVLSEQTHAKHSHQAFLEVPKLTIKTPAELGNLVETKCLQCKDPHFATCTHGWRIGATLDVVIKTSSYFTI